MSCHLGTLAWKTSATEVLDLGGHAPPDITAADVPEESIAALVHQTMDSGEKAGNQ